MADHLFAIAVIEQPYARQILSERIGEKLGWYEMVHLDRALKPWHEQRACLGRTGLPWVALN